MGIYPFIGKKMPQSCGIRPQSEMCPPNNAPCKIVANDYQKMAERSNEEIRIYQEHVAKITEVLKKKDEEIAKLTGDNEKLSVLSIFLVGQVEKHRKKLDDLYDAEDLLQIERHHNIKLQAELEDYKSKRAKVAKELAREAKKGQRWMEDVARLTKNNAKLTEENARYLRQLKATERDVEATRDELELINQIVGGIDERDGPKASDSAITLLNKLKNHRNSHMDELKSAIETNVKSS